jgi:hypothetical protein
LSGTKFDGAILTNANFQNAKPPSMKTYKCFLRENSSVSWRESPFEFKFSKMNDSFVWVEYKSPVNALIGGNVLGWGTDPTHLMAAGGEIVPGQYSAGAIFFQEGANSTYFWPDGSQLGSIFQGCIQTLEEPGRILDFRGVLLS